MSMNKYRKRIDALDAQIRSLLEERFSISKEIGNFKFKCGLRVLDTKREEEIMGRISGKFQKEIQEIYRLILMKSRELQKIDYFLVGKTLTYTFSPLIYEFFGLNNYGLFETTDFNQALEKDFKAINVTNPHKHRAFLACKKTTEIARRTEAVNIMVREEDGFFGDNTDYWGFNALLDHYGFDPKGKKCLIIGRGASGRMISLLLKDRGAADMKFMVREIRGENEVLLQDYGEFLDYELIINATPYGTYPENTLEPLFPLKNFKKLEAAIDLIYNPSLTPLLREARKYNIPTADGLYMLVAQASRNLYYFTGKPPENLDDVYRKVKLYRANIVLIGMPYSGKSTLGEKLSKALGKEFVDIDRRLLEKGRDIESLLPDIEAFRCAEAEETILHAKGWNQVIACGGGIVLNPEAMAYLQGNGVVVFLDVALEKLAERLDGSRPLIRNEGDLWQTYRERIALYKKYGDIIIKDGNDINEITEKIYEYLGN